VETARDLYGQGVEFQAKGLFDLAIQSYNKALKLDSENLDVMINLGAAYLQKGLPEKASQVLGQILERNPDHAMALFNLGKVHLYRDEAEKALAVFEHAQAVLPHDLDVRRSIGQCLMHLDRTDEAMAVFQSLLEPLADDPTVPLDLGRLLLRRDHPEQALGMLKRAVTIAPDHTEALTLLARAHLAMNAPDKALTALKRAQMSDPRNPELHTMMVGVLLEKKDLEAAVTHLKHAVSADPASPTLKRKLEELTRRLPVLKKRIGTSTLVEKASPYETEVYDILDALYDGRTQLEHAIAAMKTLLERDATDLFIADELANLLFQGRRYDEATELYSRIHLADPGQVRHRINLAKSLALQGEVTEAKAFLTDSARDFPRSLELPLAQVELCLLERDFTTARTVLESTLAKHPTEDPHALFLLGYISFRQGNLDFAQTTFKKLLKISPDDEEVVLWWSRLMILRGTPREALPMWDRFQDGIQSLVEIITRIELLMAAGENSDAVKALLLTVKHHEPRFLEDHLLFGKAYFYSGDFHSAMEKFQGVLAEEPNNAEALTFAAITWLIRNKTPRFWSMWQRAIEADSLHPVLSGLVLRRLLTFTQLERMLAETAKIRDLIVQTELDKARLQHFLTLARTP